MGGQKPIEEILSGWDGFERPEDGTMYQHYKGGRYEIVATGFLEDSITPCVVYRSLDKDIVWVRSAQDFFEIIVYEGRDVPRFSVVVG